MRKKLKAIRATSLKKDPVYMLVAALTIMAFACLFTEAAAAEEPAKKPTIENLYNPSLSGQWKAIKKGKAGSVTIPDKKAAILIQTGGETWRAFRTGPLQLIGGFTLGGMVLLLAAFYAFKGRIKISAGESGELIERFNFLERVMHWTMAVSFIVLALTGLNLIYGRGLLLPLIGGEAFASFTLAGKWLHNFFGFSFIIALIWTFFSWVGHNLPKKEDLTWLKAGGGFIGDAHPPARKFNAGQKIIFWVVILCGISISISGWALMNPFTMTMFASTFETVNGLFGTTYPTDLTLIQEQQYQSLWHSIMAVFMIVVVLAHIYIGTIGMEGAMAAMTSGDVDINWAREHHSIWVEEEEAKNWPVEQGGDEAVQPAE